LSGSRLISAVLRSNQAVRTRRGVRTTTPKRFWIQNPMSTQELIAAKHDRLLGPETGSAAPRGLWARLFSSPPLQTVIYLGSDLFALTLAHVLALHMVEHFLRIPFDALNPYEYHRLYIPFFAIVLFGFEGYKSPELRRPEQELERSCKAVVVCFMCLMLFNFFSFRAQPFSRYLVVAWFVLALTLLTALRLTLRAFYAALWSAGLCRRRALMIGSAASLVEFQQLLSIQQHHGYDFVGALLDLGEQAALPPLVIKVPVIGTKDEWEKALAATGADVLVVAYPAVSDGEDWLGKMLRRCKERRVDVELYSDVLATKNLNFEHDEFSGCFRFFPKPLWSLAVQRLVGSGINLLLGLVGTAITLLLAPVIYVLVNLEDRGPVFHPREFVGNDGRLRYYLKFRTMKINADEILKNDVQLRAKFDEKFKLVDDPRVLRVGRFLRKYSIDEFPQFFSLLKRDLTLVGPRVISQAETSRYGTLLPKLLSVKPGITGFWQVMGRQSTTYQERIRMDMFYIDHWSVWLDLIIIAKTVWKVILAEGAY
jgi:exopolysaccharide biosynthesis polyprenyl glycosylphosphotransferase